MESTVIGLIAATLTTVAFIPQVITTVKLKETKDISLGMYSLFSIGIIIWLIYGILQKDLPMILANSITIILASVILSFKLRYG